MKVPLLILVATGAAVLWWLAWPALAFFAAVVFVAVVGGFTVRFLNAAWRTYTSGRDDGPSPVPALSGEPGFPRYLAGQVWRDYTAVLREVVAVTARPMMLLGIGATQMLVGGWKALALAPVALAAVVGLLAGAVGCAVVLVLVSAGYAGIAGLVGGVQLAAGLVVRGLDGVLVSARRTRPACSHPGCYQPFPRPEYGCPGCDARHRDLVPGRHGVLRRVCRCGAGLPTSVLLGRGRLTGYCPHCHRPLASGVGQAPLVHLPVVGGPAAGKTTYTHLAVDALDGVGFADPHEAEGFAERVSALRGGTPVPRTVVELARATVLNVTLDDARKCLLYLFDPPGEHYTSSDRIAWQRYLDLATGLLLVVDPLTLDGVRRSLTYHEVAMLSDVPPSTEDPAHVIDRLVGALRTRTDGGRLDRIAVVVTKIDALRRTAVGQPLIHGTGPDPVRDWLERAGWGNPMRTLDRMAGEVRYFMSGLDLPAGQLAEPVRWLAMGSLQGRWVRGLPDAVRPLDPRLSTLAPHQIPGHYRLLRHGMLGTLWLLTVASLAGFLSVVGIAVWQALLH